MKSEKEIEAIGYMGFCPECGTGVEPTVLSLEPPTEFFYYSEVLGKVIYFCCESHLQEFLKREYPNRWRMFQGRNFCHYEDGGE